MDYEELVKMGQKARRETEDFINHYMHDQRKRWPVVCRSAWTKEERIQMELFGGHSQIRTAAG